MDVSECESSTEGETMELQHFSHQHPLVFFKYQQTVASEEVDPEAALCRGCEKPVEGWSYGCNQCEFYLHKGCAELELAPQIQHPFHPKHPLTLLPESLYPGGCDFCGKAFRGFVYNCYDCRFDLHINCALLQSSVAANFPNSLHPHPLFFIQNHNNEVDSDCPGCQKPISGPFYHCSDCSYPTFFNLHKECAELPLEINHPCDRKHPLTLLPQPPTHPQKCSCSMCRIQWKGFVYSCSLCNFDLSLDDFLFSPPTITVPSHEHPWMLVSRKMSFVCDFCGTDGDHSPYFCATCHLLVHKNCISLPRHIMITRHRHTISLSYSFRQNQVEDGMCRVCYLEVDPSYGSYRCSASDCNYIAHALCATDKAIWDGTITLEGYDERSEEVVHEPWNLITDVVEQISIGELMVASEIKHSYHDHNLRLTFSGKTKDEDSQCDGCTRPISTPFYSCEQCKFFLHKDCAELPKKMPHPFHRHFLTLTNSVDEEGNSWCHACDRCYQGFSYECYEGNCSFRIDIQCMLFSDTLKHPSHEHSLFLVHNNQGTSCSACFKELYPWNVAYRCMKRCDFSLDVRCATLPLTAWYKYDRHPLSLTYSDDSEPSQHYCDLCEKEREPNRWFYYCADCDNSLHLNCAIGDLPYMKLGNKFKYFRHKHPFIVVKNIWNCPPCKVCGEVCNGQALECKESECNFTVHRSCLWRLK
ncbi:hypothetical protein ERO13_A02G026300v2 [Gossypium hirsutum]|uniref:Phorbol-ester/DAG-type domain-containing protein n=1 Tax=Gossypium hirsutum TaxID=3635 RepID=A0A1U8P9W3_GOSHI|nr:uncharacterized protein LOC107957064 [Gossypium hirsutum]KAG4210139.1 hypothetical protein ERO13_A02G026300v2 [Gossypium hirsutum]